LKNSKGKRAENKEEAKKLKKKIDFFNRYCLLKCVLRFFMNSEYNQLIVMIEVKFVYHVYKGPPLSHPLSNLMVLYINLLP
jgi:hypothetical protein